MTQQSMFPPAVEAMNVSIYRSDTYGWHMRIGVRLDSERWCNVAWRQYDHLSMAEVLDVLDAEASRVGPMIS